MSGWCVYDEMLRECGFSDERKEERFALLGNLMMPTPTIADEHNIPLSPITVCTGPECRIDINILEDIGLFGGQSQSCGFVMCDIDDSFAFSWMWDYNFSLIMSLDQNGRLFQALQNMITGKEMRLHRRAADPIVISRWYKPIVFYFFENPASQEMAQTIQCWCEIGNRPFHWFHFDRGSKRTERIDRSNEDKIGTQKRCMRAYASKQLSESLER